MVNIKTVWRISKCENQKRNSVVARSRQAFRQKAKTVEGETVKFYSVTINKAYKDGEDWEHTNSLNIENLPKVALVANETYKYVRFRENDLQQK